MFYVISKLFTGFILPPGIFVLVFLFIAFKSKQKLIKLLSITFAIFLYLISTKPVANLLLSPLENIKASSQKASYTILLGGGFSFNDFFKFSAHSFKREVYSYIISKDNKLIFTGAQKEIKAFKMDYETFNKYFGVNVKYYLTKPSNNTYQNAFNTSQLFEKNGWEKKIYLVTSAFHMKRSIKIFKHFGFEVIPKPVDFLRDYNYSFIDFIPNAGNFYKSYIAIHEYFGILSLKLRGL